MGPGFPHFFFCAARLLAHLFFCASEIRFRASALIRLGPLLRPLLTPAKPDPVLLGSALACCNFSISMSSDRMMSVLSMAGRYILEKL